MVIFPRTRFRDCIVVNSIGTNVNVQVHRTGKLAIVIGHICNRVMKVSEWGISIARSPKSRTSIKRIRKTHSKVRICMSSDRHARFSLNITLALIDIAMITSIDNLHIYFLICSLCYVRTVLGGE